MNKLHWLPLEILDKRYTAQTRKWYGDEFKKHFDVNMIEGEQLTSKIESGSFLDAYGTNYYKFTQLAEVAKQFRDKKINDGDIFFIDDLWMPGLEGIKYMEKMGKEMNIKIYGVMHAGSWIPSDDVATKLGKQKWCKKYEKSLFDLLDGVFVGSQFHKDMITSYMGKNIENKIYNTGLPFYPSEIHKQTHEHTWKNKSNIVIFPHRLHPEKHPDLFDNMKNKFKDKYPNWDFIKTMDLDLNKNEYLELLNKSKIMVSYADQENFGFSTLEAATLGCALILPNRVVYPEFYPKSTLYNTISECENKVEKIIKQNEKPHNIHNTKVTPYIFEHSIKKMVEVINNDRTK